VKLLILTATCLATSREYVIYQIASSCLLPLLGDK